MKIITSLILLSMTVSRLPASEAVRQSETPPATYNVVWDSQSTGSVDSMPLSGGNLGLNVWVENNELLFLAGGPNNMDEDGMQVKLGLVRLKLDPAVFAASFRQELRLGRSEIVVSGRTASGKPASVTLWCDMARPVIHAELNSGEPVTLTASYETWSSYEAKTTSSGLQWVRRLPEENPRRLSDLKAQGMSEFAASVPDPLSKLTTGGRLDAPGLVPADAAPGKFNGMPTKVCAVKTEKPVTSLDLVLTLRMEQDRSLTDWENGLAADAGRAVKSTLQDRAAALAWWGRFWDRSHIVIAPTAGVTPEKDKAWQAARNYQLVRYMLASNTSGRAMTLFNGGNFACTGNPDSRNWDGCQFMAQNQRLVYWPMLRSGDFDMLKVAGDFYRDRTELSRKHAKKFWGIDGVAYCEAYSIFGLGALGTTADGRCNPPHLNYHYTSGMEFALMMLEMGRYTGRDFPGYTEPALGIISYYDQYYQKSLQKKTGKPLDETGRIVIYPSDACEPYHGCTNNTDVIAGLDALSRTLLALPSGKLDSQKRSYVEGFRKRIPEYPMDEKDGYKFFKAARSWENVMYNGNMDFPQMYVCFPFSTLSLGRSDMSLAKNTWKYSAINESIQHQNQCWYQTSINFARMGMARESGEFTLSKLLFKSMRFPTYYHTHYAVGGEFCHVPDTDHGGVAMTALQEMLMQTDGKRILLAPAWPKEWNVDFKLCAPYQTTVAGRVENGKVIIDQVTPEARRKDIEIFEPQATHLGELSLSTGKAASASSCWDASYPAGLALDGELSTRWSSGKGDMTGWLQVDLGESTTVSRAVIREVSYPRVEKFELQVQATGSGPWVSIAEGTTLGEAKELTFSPVSARSVRLVIEKSKEEPTIDEIQLFAK